MSRRTKPDPACPYCHGGGLYQLGADVTVEEGYFPKGTMVKCPRCKEETTMNKQSKLLELANRIEEKDFGKPTMYGGDGILRDSYDIVGEIVETLYGERDIHSLDYVHQILVNDLEAQAHMFVPGRYMVWAFRDPDNGWWRVSASDSDRDVGESEQYAKSDVKAHALLAVALRVEASFLEDEERYFSFDLDENRRFGIWVSSARGRAGFFRTADGVTFSTPDYSEAKYKLTELERDGTLSDVSNAYVRSFENWNATHAATEAIINWVMERAEDESTLVVCDICWGLGQEPGVKDRVKACHACEGYGKMAQL